MERYRLTGTEFLLGVMIKFYMDNGEDYTILSEY